MSNIAENICEAINIISIENLNGLSYDKTVVCTITDDSKRDKGIYTVKEDAASYTAYSENTTYRKNNQVYVTIPGNDYNNQKIIVGKKVSEKNEPVIYDTPFDTLIDIVGLNPQMPEKVPGLTANRPETYYDVYFGEELEVLNTLYEKINGVYELTTDTEYDSNKTYYKQYNNGSLINIYSGNFYDAPYYGFTRLGLQADFKAWLREYNCMSGDYGLKMTVDFVADERVETNENGEEVNTIDVARRILYLSCADMVGNPYQFESFYTQEKVFDITDYGGIAAISIDFYQQPDSFKMNKKDNEDNFISVPYMDELGNHLLSNLFVQNWDIIIGYDIGSYDTDVAKLYCLQSDEYATVEDKKIIDLKWVHIDDNGSQIVMNQYVKNYKYEIRWYRYLLGEPSADNYCGSSWTSITDEINSENIDYNSDNPFQIILTPNTVNLPTESIKAIILFGEAPGYDKITLTKEEYIASTAKYYYKDGNNYINCLDVEWDNVKGKDLFVKQIDNRVIYKTQILEFKNQTSVISSGTIDALSALTLTCFDKIDNKLYGTQGNYLIYNQGNQLIDYGQSAITRGVRCKFNLVSTEDDDTETLNRAETVTWIFPLKNTMIIPQMPVYGGDTGIEYIEVNENLIETTENPVYGMLKYDNAAIRAQMTVENNLYASPYFLYKIGTYFASSKLNNYIQCIVEKDGVSYRTAKDLTFGQAGSAGTEYTFVLELEKNVNALTAGKEQSVKITGLLYDSTGKEQNLTGKTIEWNFVNPQDTSKTINTLTNLSFDDDDENDNISKTLTTTEDLTIDTMCIVQATLMDWGNYKLTTYLPIPIRNSDEHICVSGTTSIVYLTDGSPQYYNSNYQFHTTSTDELIKNPSWKPFYGSDDVESNPRLMSYFPSLSERELGTYLQPVSMFVKGLPMFAVQAYVENIEDTENNLTILWTQPILMIENRYPAAMINAWDGKELKIDNSKNAILSKMMGAGSKEEDNSFSGVLMGDWTEEVQVGTDKTMANYTGLFGFNQGAMSFSFTDDGKATIGKATGAQLIFDGNESTISSASYQNNKKGLFMDFDDSILKLCGGTTKEDNKFILFDASDNNVKNNENFALQIGDADNMNFKVNWKGDAVLNNATVKGLFDSSCKITGSYEIGGTSYQKDTLTLNNIITKLTNAIDDVAYAAENAENAIERLQNFFDINTNATESEDVNITMQNYFYDASKKKYFHGAGYVQVGKAVYVSGDQGTKATYGTPGVNLMGRHVRISPLADTGIILAGKIILDANCFGSEADLENLKGEYGRIFFVKE